jgi:hypothetical protein
MNMRTLTAAALLAIASFAAEAQAVAPPAPAAGSDPADATRRICRVSPANGSRLGGTRTCRTRDEWAQAQREARSTTDRIQRVSPACLMGPNDPRMGGGPHLVCGSFGP